MSTPPFAIVHVNKAFCEVSGLTHADVTGKPVEEILQVEDTIPAADRGANSAGPLKSRFLVSDCKACQIHVTPITDRSKNTRGMTHVLVKIDSVINHLSNAEKRSPSIQIGIDSEKLTPSSRASDDGSSATETTGSHKVTIG